MKKQLFLIIETNKFGVESVWSIKAVDKEDVAQFVISNEDLYFNLLTNLGYSPEEFAPPTVSEFLEAIENAYDDEELDSTFDIVGIPYHDIQDVDEIAE